MEQFEFGHLSKRNDRIGHFWVFFSSSSEHNYGNDRDLLDVLNQLGCDGWQAAFQIHYNESNREQDIILQRRR